ncbi:oxygen-independent coproporphyrinogen III oxidase [uncultured Roseobacter sp.]|uniref:oxygen-independent coproporphyrinogen III oxidase n=1 Tax=uncultured Roseobacter sp. TaxID=114847 RepID=UPI002637B550|nr:oxygen-independent coproporphyrinogen III oxidase [uncultured Roseobacter sp.]
MHMNSQMEKLGLFDARVPRYTSYPTAPRFSAAVGPDQMANWLSQIRPGSGISLYLHIPFCRRLCWFCACRTQGTRKDGPVAAYLKTLAAELDLLARHLPEGVTLSRMHWGGGTPTLLSPSMITGLAERIAQVAPFSPGAEFSVEVDPNEIDQQRVDSLARAGMNRASIGVQDFDGDVQRTIGRIQGFEATRDAADMLRAAGIRSLNADILFGLPHQDRARIAATVQSLLTLSPDRVALYGYAHVPWMARRQSLIPSDALPAPKERLALFDTARQLFEWDGYRQIGIDHFALPDDTLAIAARNGTLRRNFQGYTDEPAETLVGLGASAISRFPQGYTQNQPATSSHTASIRAGHFSTVRGHMFTDEDRLRARIIEALMCDFEVRSGELENSFPDLSKLAGTLLDSAAHAFGDTVKRSESGLRIVEGARPLTRIIARHFDAYQVSQQAHASAI